MADFTPAPLKIGENEDGEAVVFRDINNPVLGIAVCHYHGINSNKKTMWANARLFAAAPEMYEALMDVANHTNHDGKLSINAFKKVLQALDKADGLEGSGD